MASPIRAKVHALTTNSSLAIFIRLGYFIRGVLYAVIGFFALESSFGIHKSLSQYNVIAVFSTLPFGYYLLFLFIGGLGGYALWGFIRAFLDIIDHRIQSIPFFQRAGYLLSGIVYGSLFFSTLFLVLHVSHSPSAQYNITTLAHMLFSLPFGRLLLGIAGIIGFVGAALQIHKAMRAKSPDDMYFDSETTKALHILMPLSRLAIASRAIVWMIISLFLLFAAYEADPDQAKNMNDLFSSQHAFPFASEVLGILAIGFILFGLYSCSLAFWVDLPAQKT